MTKRDEKLFRDIRYHTTRQVEVQSAPKKIHRQSIDITLNTIEQLLPVGDIPGPAFDGYSSTTPGNGSGGGGGGRRMFIPADKTDKPNAEFTDPDWVPTSSTEAAAMAALMGERIERDELARIAEDARRGMQLAADGHALMASAAQRFERARAPFGLTEGRNDQCFIARSHKLPWDEHWRCYKTTDFGTIKFVEGKKLDQPEPVCVYVYAFVRDNKRYPTESEMRRALVKANA